jgi:hypothetical protein
MTKKPESKKAAAGASKPERARQMPESLGAAPPITLTAAPSAEWLTKMLMQRVESATEEYRQRNWESASFSRDEVLLHEAAVILDNYRMARWAIEIATGKTRDPLRLEEMFTKEEIKNGVEFGSKREPGWPEIVTGYSTRDLALKALKDWVDWEQSPGPEWCRRAPRQMHEIPGAGFVDSTNGEDWLKWTCKILEGWKSCRDVYLMRRHYLQYEEILKWEKDAKGPWEKRRKKVLGETSGKNSEEVGKKVVQPGKLAKAKPAVRKRKKAD